MSSRFGPSAEVSSGGRVPRPNSLVVSADIPPIPRVQAWGQAYTGERGPLMDLCQAVPGYPPNPAMLNHLAAAGADRSSAKYGPIAGDLRLRDVYAAHVSEMYGAKIGLDQVAITAGCNQAFFAVLLTVVEQGNAVLLPTPWYYNHKMTCDMLGLEARPLPCTVESSFLPDPSDAEKLLDERVRAIALVTPNNPTGAIYSPELIARFHQLCVRHNLWLILDETYRDFLPADARAPHGLLIRDNWSDNAVQIYSFSKAYALPGQRLGAITASASLMPHLMKVLDCMHICANRVGQAALHWGIDALAGWRAEKRAEDEPSGHRDARRFQEPSGLADQLARGLLRICAPSIRRDGCLETSGVPSPPAWGASPSRDSIRGFARPCPDLIRKLRHHRDQAIAAAAGSW